MIQSAMVFVLGMLVAGLVALLVTPAIWRRAMRLARTRIEASVPLSRAEIEADKDQLRAGFAVANRRLEMEAGKLRERLGEGSIALSRRTEEVGALLRDKDTLVETIAALESRITEISGALTETDGNLTRMTGEVAARDARLAERETTLATLRAELGAAQLMTEELRLEMVARQTEISNLSDSLVEKTTAEQAAVAGREGLAGELGSERERLAAAAKHLQGLEASFEVLQTERAGRLAELERRVAEVRTLEGEIASEIARRQALTAETDAIRADRARLAAELTERGGDVASLTAALGEAERQGEALRQRLAAAEAELAARSASPAGGEAVEGGDNLRKALSATEAEKADLMLRTAALEDDLDALRAENADLRRVAGAEWESEREGNRRLRERLNEIAAGVVRLTQSLEGNGNAGEAAGDTLPGAPIPIVSVQRPAANAPATEPGDNTLAERLRALQHAARH